MVVFALLFAPVFALLFAGCESARPPSYVRLSGEAPVVEGVPRDGAWLVSFWATWCVPCREETPALRKLARSPSPDGLRVLLVSEDRSLDEVRAYFGGAVPEELKVHLDEGGRLLQAYGADQLPVTFLVVDGQLLARFDGVREWDRRGVRELLGRLVSEASSARRARPVP